MKAQARADAVMARLRAMARPRRAAAIVAETPMAEECLGLPVPDMRSVVREFAPEVRRAAPQEAVDLAFAILAHGTFDGRACAYELLEKNRAAMDSLRTRTVERLGRGVDNWNSVDTFACVVSGPCWRRGQVTDAAVHRWARSRDPWWRRTAVVSTVPLNLPSRGGRGDVGRTVRLCEVVVGDPHVMVRKALSWALRTLVRVDRGAVEEFLVDHADSLSPRVVRETRRKLQTGRKNG